MPNPFRLKVLMALTDAIEEITVAGGYQHDLTDNVFRGRISFSSEEGDLPMVSINEKPVFPEQLETPEGHSAAKTTLDLLIQGFADDDRENPTDPAYRLLADVQKRLAQEKLRDDGYDILGFGERITAIGIGQGVVRPPDAVVSDTAYFWLPLTLTFAENLNEPFA